MVHNNTFISNTSGNANASALSIDGSATSTQVVKNLMVSNHPVGMWLSAGTTNNYNGFFMNGSPMGATSSVTVGTHALVGQEPLLFMGDPCQPIAYWPQPGSPVIDRGDPTILDVDGTRSDIGGLGGPASAAASDTDGDGAPDVFDCAEDEPAAYPGAAEVCDGIEGCLPLEDYAIHDGDCNER